MKAPKISSAEWEVMSVIWSNGPATATEVYATLPQRHGWKQKTVNTFLTRLVEKGALALQKDEKPFVYSARVSREKCVQDEGEFFLQRVFKGAAGDLMLHFCAKANLTGEEIQELEQLLKSKKAGK
jgi:BlaI family penicillinase repressor